MSGKDAKTAQKGEKEGRLETNIPAVSGYLHRIKRDSTITYFIDKRNMRWIGDVNLKEKPCSF